MTLYQKVDQCDIPSALIVNIDQTPLKYVPVVMKQWQQRENTM